MLDNWGLKSAPQYRGNFFVHSNLKRASNCATIQTSFTWFLNKREKKKR